VPQRTMHTTRLSEIHSDVLTTTEREVWEFKRKAILGPIRMKKIQNKNSS